MPIPSRGRTVSPPKSRQAMAVNTIDFDTVREIGLALPGVEESTAYGCAVLKLNGRIMAGIPANRPDVEPGSLGVCVDREDRAEFLAAAPDVYYLTDHYVTGNWVLVRMSRINRDVLKDLLGMAHKFVTRRRAQRPAARKRRKGVRNK